MPSEFSTGSAHSKHSDLSAISETSTLAYDQVPFEEYVPVVKRLCRQLWPSTTEEIEIERLKGGGFNRVIGITTHDVADHTTTRYVLRIPRFEDTRPDRELAIHQYVQEHTSIPIAEAVFSDLTSENVLGKPYVIQKRLLGENLHYTYETLDHERKKAIAEQWGRILLGGQAVRNDGAGLVEATQNADGTHVFHVCQYDVDPELDTEPDKVALPSDRSVLKMFLSQFRRWAACDLQLDPENPCAEEDFARFSKIASEMDAAGLFSDKYFYLTHLDLEPRNVLIDATHDDSAVVSGVLDWDSAIFAPIFVSCKPPTWIWAWKDNDYEEEENEFRANETPEDPQQRELKQIFEDTVGPAYLKYAYQPEYRLARKLFILAKDGLRSSWAFSFAESLEKEWAEVKAHIGLSGDSVAVATELLEKSGIANETVADSPEYVRSCVEGEEKDNEAVMNDIGDSTDTTEDTSAEKDQERGKSSP